MINFPVFERIEVEGYGLFPGGEGPGVGVGLHVTFQPGLTLVLGANGLGKTTLINIMYRLLTGPFDIPALASRSDIGFSRLTPTRLPYPSRTIFAARVADGARNARASLVFRLGSSVITIERRLSDLTLTRFNVDENEYQTTSEEGYYQAEISKLAGVSSFGDWILLLMYLVFYFEERRALVWDPSAQRQILRMMFLPVEVANKWTVDERAILEQDSRMRNLNATLYREESELSKSEKMLKTNVNVRQELQALEELQKADCQLREQTENELLELDKARHNARQKALKAEQVRETQYRSIERARLFSIRAAFPNRSQVGVYILSHLLANDLCLACGSRAQKAAAEYTYRVDHHECPICKSNLNDSLIAGDLTGDKIDVPTNQDVTKLERIEIAMAEAQRVLEETEQSYNSRIQQLTEISARINDRSFQIDRLVKQLPPDEAVMHKQRSELSSLRGRVEELRAELISLRESFKRLIENVNRDIVQCKDEVKAAFDGYAEGFLLEQCQLIWSPQKTTVGQGGASVDFPAFELDMTGSDFPSPVRRTGPEQVSESQREFIDLAFRMALMHVSTDGGSGSIVMDAPESSLDAVFASRAANVLSKFGNPELGNRLVVTSNLVEGQLIPDLISKSMITTDRSSRLVDLVQIAAPTAAVRENRAQYEAIFQKLSVNHTEKPAG